MSTLNNPLHRRTRPLAELGWTGWLRHGPSSLGCSIASLVGMICLSLAATLTEGVGVGLLYPLIELMQSGQNPEALAQRSTLFRIVATAFADLGLSFSLGTLVVTAGAIIMVRQALTYFSAVFRAHVGRRAVERISVRTFRLFIEADVGYAERFRSGSMMNAVFTEAKRAGTLVLAAQGILSGILRIAIYVGLLLFVSWQATLIGLVLLALGTVALSHRTVRASRSTGANIARENDRLTIFATEQFGLLRLIKVARTADLEAATFARRAASLRRMNVQLARYAARLNAFIEGAVVLCSLALVYGAATILQMSLAALGIFLIAVLRLMPVVQELAVNAQLIAGNLASVHYIDALDLEAAAARERDEGKHDLAGLKRGILFHSVSFDYRGRGDAEPAVPALQQVTLTIPAGQTTALLGPSGAGKSTLMDLIPRLRERTQGRILFDDVPIEEIRLASLRSNIAVVSQDALVLDGTIEENLCYGHPDIGKDALIAAAKDANAHDFIMRLPMGYDTVVGERGVLLSGGQKQRLALARALVGRASILLLDEPTSALDAESEQAVQQALARLQASRVVTIVIIAHRLSTVRHADHIIVLDEGRVLGSGTHDQLMTSAPWYRNIVQLQLGEAVP